VYAVTDLVWHVHCRKNDVHSEPAATLHASSTADASPSTTGDGTLTPDDDNVLTRVYKRLHGHDNRQVRMLLRTHVIYLFADVSEGDRFLQRRVRGDGQ
jgi:hypothetical protein